MYKVAISCEHAGNWIPLIYKKLFRGKSNLLNSHKGYDIGAIQIYSNLIKDFGDFHILNKVSRLLVDVNRRLESKELFSEITKELNEEEKAEIVRDYYLQFRANVEDWVGSRIRDGFKVVHFSIHTFTPELEGKIRDADIGLLYDPKRESEKKYCEIWKRELQKIAPDFKVRYNYPYKGKDDGMTSYLREIFPDEIYTGLELEVNQKHLKTKKGQSKISKIVKESILNTHDKFSG